jgi:serine/threonine protein kinase/Tfp pilus assembly protein PilF
MLAAGKSLGDRYEIVSQIGSGGMGVVFQAHDLRLGRDVAIKILPQHLSEDPTALARFDREAKALASLSHANILAIHDFQNDQGLAFAVMELLQGETLRAHLSTETVPWNKAAQIGVAIADGLTAAHSRGVVHRDLKPENVFLMSDGGIKILDFGLAQVEAPVPVKEQSSAPTQSTTDPGTVVGTMHYMSPEQLRGANVDARTDIFALGCILFEMLTGTRPFSRKTNIETAAAILKEDPAVLPFLDEKTPEDSRQIVLHCLEKDPGNRFQTARDLSFALKTIMTLSGSTSRVPFTKPKRRRSARKAMESIAVLPLENVGGNSNAEYLSDGITESLINSLSQLPKLRVMARSTVFRYKNQRIDPIKIGQDLDVGAVLTGRVVQRGDVLSIQAELVDVSDGSQLWGEQYTRGMSDIISLQEDISREISGKLRLRISGETKDRLTKRYTENTEAYELYLKGRYYWSRRTADGLKKAIDFFQKAIEKDPAYALAYTGIADCYNLLSAYGLLSPKESVLIAKQAAMRALELDNEIAEGHEALAHVKMLYDWDWKVAEAEFKRALQLNPNYAPAHQRYAIHLATMGRIEEATKEIKRAQQIDPLSLIINTDITLILYLQERYEEAIEQCYKTLELDPNFSVAHFQLGLAMEQVGRFDEAIEAFGRGVTFSGDRTFLSASAYTFARSGRLEEARKLLNAVLELSEHRYVSPYRIATIYVGLNETEKAIEWFMRAYQERSVWLIHLHMKVDPRLKSLHSDQRFKEILHLIGF